MICLCSALWEISTVPETTEPHSSEEADGHVNPLPSQRYIFFNDNLYKLSL